MLVVSVYTHSMRQVSDGQQCALKDTLLSVHTYIDYLVVQIDVKN